MKARKLKHLRIRRVDLVAGGANQFADVVLFKSADSYVCKKCGQTMKADQMVCPKCNTPREETAKKAAEERQMAENTEQIKKLQDDLKAATDRAGTEAEKAVALEKALKDQGETIAQLKKQAEEMQDAAKLAEFKKTVDAFEHLPVKADTFAPILMKCAAALDAAGYTELMRVLKAADAATASNFAEIGAPGADTATRSAAEELDAKADELVTKSAGALKKDAALVQAMVQNPKLAARYRRESYAARPAES